jgi:hypothetical protein
MSFVGGVFAHDLFVSYAHAPDLDQGYDKAHESPLTKWSRIFVDDLRTQIKLNLSVSHRDSLSHADEALDVWMDPKLGSTGSLSHNLNKEIEKSALLIVLMSPYYLSSPWCQEATIFSDQARQFRAVERRERIFVVAIAATDGHEWPEGRKNMVRHAVRL